MDRRPKLEGYKRTGQGYTYNILRQMPSSLKETTAQAVKQWPIPQPDVNPTSTNRDFPNNEEQYNSDPTNTLYLLISFASSSICFLAASGS